MLYAVRRPAAVQIRLSGMRRAGESGCPRCRLCMGSASMAVIFCYGDVVAGAAALRNTIYYLCSGIPGWCVAAKTIIILRPVGPGRMANMKCSLHELVYRACSITADTLNNGLLSTAACMPSREGNTRGGRPSHKQL